MTIVNVIGDNSDTAFSELVLLQLSCSYRVTYINENSIIQSGNGYEVVIAEFQELKCLNAPECIIVMKADGIVPSLFQTELPSKCIIIANSENAEQLSALKEVDCTVITCGISEKDTLSCSSYGSLYVTDIHDAQNSSLMVSLNREITAFSGRTVQPLEMPLKVTSSENIYYTLALTALRLILDDFNSELGKLI
ncbi:MAG: hypothetical protein FWF76_02300 [Oscillospiraceae bacterium]|nr:hypothetical protein [Oscillospiraceae bacterium]